MVTEAPDPFGFDATPPALRAAIEKLEPLPDLNSLRSAEDFRAASSILFNRMQFLRRADITFNGKRDMYDVLGYKTLITNRDYRDRYERGGLAGKVVDALPDAAWRGTMDVREDKDASKDTAFELAWKMFDRRLQAQATFLRVNKLSRLSNYACLLIGDGKPVDAELCRGNGTADKIVYLRPLSGGGGPANGFMRMTQRVVIDDAQISVQELDTDSTSKRFGLPFWYQFNAQSTGDPADLGKRIHYSRVIHVAEECLEDTIYGQPALQRVWNLFDDLMKVTGGGAEAFWLRANAGLHLDMDPTVQFATPPPGGKTELEKLAEQSEDYKHQMTRMMRTRGVKIEQLGSDVANFAAPAEAIVTQIAGSKGIPKRILMGSEMGELASSQDRENWKDVVNGYQTAQLGPYLVRQVVDRFVAYGHLPSPVKGVDVYEVVWPHLQTMTEDEKDARAGKLAAANASMGETLFTNSEIRDMSHGKAPLEEKEIKPIGKPEAAAVDAGIDTPELKAALRALEMQIENGELTAGDIEASLEGYEDELRALEAAIESDDADAVARIIGLGGPGSGWTAEGGHVPGGGAGPHPGEGKSASEWAQRMTDLRSTKPRPLDKLFGTNGPKPEQLDKWKSDMKAWNKEYNHASKLQKASLAHENEAFHARSAQSIDCPKCEGLARQQDGEENLCDACGGTGEVDA